MRRDFENAWRNLERRDIEDHWWARCRWLEVTGKSVRAELSWWRTCHDWYATVDTTLMLSEFWAVSVCIRMLHHSLKFSEILFLLLVIIHSFYNAQTSVFHTYALVLLTVYCRDFRLMNHAYDDDFEDQKNLHLRTSRSLTLTLSKPSRRIACLSLRHLLSSETRQMYSDVLKRDEQLRAH